PLPTQVLLPVQQPPLLHTALAQHSWLAAPQGAQAPPEQTALASLQTLPLQQGWLTPPHGMQPMPVQMALASLQTLPLQQGWLSAPQPTHTPLTHELF